MAAPEKTSTGDDGGAPIPTPAELAAERLSAVGVNVIQRIEAIFASTRNLEGVRLRDKQTQLWMAFLNKSTKGSVTTTQTAFVKIIPGRELPLEKYVASTIDYLTSTVTRTNFVDPTNSGCEGFEGLIGEIIPPLEFALRILPKRLPPQKPSPQR
jgi:hypothetical protein